MDPITCATTIGQCLLTQLGWPFLKPHVDYWWHFDGNIQELRDGIRDLDRQIQHIRQGIEGARLRTEILRPGVENWANAATEKIAEARRILQDDDIPNAWNFISRYSMGKNSKKTGEAIANLRNDGNFNAISDPEPPPSMGSTSHGQGMEFKSRKRIEEEIIESLKSTSVRMIGICGMGGVGKTTMVQRIRKRVKEEKLFEEVVMVVVSQQVDMPKIQEEIAELLGLKFDVKIMSARAEKLRTRLMDTKRKIIIFDDVWEGLKLEDLGVPFDSGFQSCKILLTTRSKDVCKNMEAQKIIAMEILTEEEAWILFKEKAGNCVEDSILLSVAKDVVAECKGLPIALVTVGKSLQDQGKSIWEDSLSQLKRSNPADFPEVLADVYKPLKLSYDNLDNERERNLFLLCCLFPEDYNIPVEKLAWYSMGLRMFDGIRNIEETRNRTHRLVEKLKSRFLLIDGQQKHNVKMHDVVRDVAIFIGSKEKDGFVKSLNKISIENSFDINCNWMSVDISNQPIEVPVGWLFPNLRLLMLLKLGYKEFSNISFEGMAGLNVLSFSSTSISSLPPTLTNLQTLSLSNCGVQEIAIIGELTSLEILSFDGCHYIMELPEEIGKLTRLRLLRLHDCERLQTIAFGVISRLVWLEELKIVNCFRGWEAKQTRKAMRNASLGELECLSHLTCLEIEIDDWNLASEDIRLSQNLVKYCITINVSNVYWSHKRGYEKVMNLNLPGNIGVVGNWIQMLVKNTECLSLKGDGSNNFGLAELENLRKLIFFYCSTMEKLLNKIDSRNLNQDVSLRYLESIEIRDCSNLRFLFSVSVARPSLLQLQVLKIESCDKLEQVFWNETDACIEFSKLKELRLINLPNLTAFCHGLENIIKFPNLTKMRIENLPKLKSLSCLNSEARHDDTTSHQFLCNEKVKFGNLKKLRLDGMDNNIRNIWCSQISIDFFNNLEELRISYLNGIRSLMSYSIAKNLVSLRSLVIAYCEEIVEVIEGDDDKQVVDIQCLFPALKILEIYELPKLRMFWKWNGALELPLLEYVDIYNCPVMETFTFESLNIPNIRSIIIVGDDSNNFNGAELENLRKLIFRNCSTMEKLLNEIDRRNLNQDVSLRYFESIEITDCSNLRFLFSVSVARTSLLQLQVLEIGSCDKLEQVFWNEIRDDRDACIEFPKLKELTLYGLPNLTAFCHGLENIIKFPNLRRMRFDNLPKLKSLSPLNSEAPHEDTTSHHFLCSEKVKFGNLKNLTLGRMDNNIRNIWCSQISNDFFNNLEELDISGLNGIRSLMSCSIAKNLVSLKYLRINSCEEIVEVIEGDDDKQVFPALKKLLIGSMPKLRMFWKWNGSLELPLLEDVTIEDCPVMETFTLGSLNTTSFHFLFNEKVKFGNLKNLTLDRMDNIRNIWCSQISIDSFNNLEELKISGLNGIRSLMSYSIAKNLVSLKSLEIGFCEEIVEVIEGDDDKQVVDIQCLFPALKILSFRYLHKLRRFWKWNGALELPLLEYVYISYCPVMETFTLGSLNTPNIRWIIIERTELKLEKDLNHGIRSWYLGSRTNLDSDNYDNEDVDENEGMDDKEA